LIAEAAKASGSLLMEGYHYFFHPAFKFVKSQIDAGVIGEITQFRGDFCHPIPNKPEQLRYIKSLGGGALMDLGCYPLHAFRHLIGEPDIITAKAKPEGDVDVSMHADVSCAGVSGKIICDMGPNASGIVRLDITGTKGRIVFDNFVAPHNGHKITVTCGADTALHEIDGPSTYRAQLDHFISAVGGGSTDLSPADSILQMQAIDAIYGASR